ncbi:hypothetical protein PVNG_06601 [Plasmodium vivax North Korean]|uniref:Uncharacterized protein n=1 Tax=Plasmodium vivax North Korean TaxID=1035514 RepID=A0A0J9TLP3_PLAVI|nr:hypothetical protein PVNG_06601 [Plasmodium vivax North Korean]
MKKDDENSILCNTESTYEPDLEDQQRATELHRKIESPIGKGQLKDADQEEAQGPNGQEAGAQVHSLQKPEAGEGDHATFLPLQKEAHAAHQDLPNELPVGEGDRVTSILGNSSEGSGSPIKTITSASMVGIPSIIFLLYKVNKTYIFKY